MKSDVDETIDEVQKDSAESYPEYKTRLASEQAGMPKDLIMDLMTEKSEYALDLDSLVAVPTQHNFIDRGEVLSCENAGHPNHRHFKRR